MATRQEFGNYLLLKKLIEDPLGETFRAGRLGQQGIDQVVLLRALNGQGFDTERLWSTLSARRPVQKALKSPNIGSGVDAGTVRGVPYVAYDYISGKDLASLTAQARRESSPFPTDHALLIADRIGLALSAAYEARLDGQRVLHGMVVPYLVMVSNEGETRLLGFAAGPALAEQAGALPEEVQRYLAPEHRSGAAPTRTGDVFSLGAILFELLTGEPLPASAPEGYGPVVRQSRLAAEGTALPPAMAELLERSLAPAGERIPDASTWHKALGKVAAEGGYNATTFNLAFFMHNLFRDEIEREGKEIEAERTMALPARSAAGVAAAGTAAPPEAGATVAGPEGADETGAVRERYGIEGGGESEGPAPRGKGLWIGIAAVLLIVAGAIAAWVFYGSGGPTDEDTVPAEMVDAPPAVPEPVVEEPAEPAGPTPEEIKAQIDAMLDEKTQAMQENLQQEYDRRIQQMQEQLAAAEEAAQERERRLEEARQQAEEERLAAQRAAEEERAAEEAAAAAETDEAEDRVAQTGDVGGRPQGGTGSGSNNEGSKASDVAQELAQRPRQQEPEAEPEPKVQVGDLVKPGPGVAPPRVVRRAPPTYPPVAARLNREATVDVQVLVDENGKVTEARIFGDESGFGFDESALQAARRSSFEPATKEGVRVKMWTTVRFVFRR